MIYLFRDARIQRQCMDAVPHELGDRLIDHAVPGDPVETPKAFGHHADTKVPAFASAGVSDVQRTLVFDENLGRPELLLDCGANACNGVRGHGFP
jgi:hypothetical protein